MIYLASSWRNSYFDEVYELLKAAKFNCYNFKQGNSFNWRDIDEDFDDWDLKTVVKNLNHGLAIQGFIQDKKAMENCDIFVMIMPCGISASLELGWAIGKGKNTIILLPDTDKEPELMFKLADKIVTNKLELLTYLIELREKMPKEYKE